MMTDGEPESDMDSLPLVTRQETLRDVVATIDRYASGIALVADAERRLLATLTDGDIRRAMLAGLGLENTVDELLERRVAEPAPLTAAAGSTSAELVGLMQAASVRQIPLLDNDGHIAGLASLEDLVDLSEPPLGAVVMAGGFGRRLAPLTDDTPKPMLPVGGRPLLEHIIVQLRDAGIDHVRVTTHYLGDIIARHFGNGEAFGVDIEYVSEEEPLGTAGALGLVEPAGPLLVMNGDLVTRVDFKAMHRFHDEHQASMTVALRPYEVHVPFGLVQLDGEEIVGIEEKPAVRGFVNAGIYLVSPEACRTIRKGERLDMPELIDRLASSGRRVVGFPLREYWLDVGQLSDYQQALSGIDGDPSE
jgi:dTDP-glucose pyrophosphorylase/CBS domain-containing protein